MSKKSPKSDRPIHQESKPGTPETQPQTSLAMAPSVNYHLTKYCNMKCNYCYATFHDLGTVKHDVEKSLRLIAAVADAGFRKITFAGGEPTLLKELPELAEWAKELGLVTTIVTNGTGLLKAEYYEQLVPHLDWVAVSIDSVDVATNLNSGRAVAGNKILVAGQLQALLQKLKTSGVKTKINTVVSASNHEENLTAFINACGPDRWKILQALPVEGQNSDHAGTFEVSDAQFKAFLERNRDISPATAVVAEEIELIKGSYIMISPEGRFYDNTSAGYKYTDEILEVGIGEALKQINFDLEKFNLRGGNYEF